MKKPVIFAQTILSILACTLLCSGCNSAFAEEVAVEESAPFVEAGGPDSLEFAAHRSGADLAMLYYVPSASADKDLAARPAAARPIAIQGGTGRDTRLGVDVSSINETAEREGWPWYAKAGVVIGCVALVGLATWGIVEASHKGSHDNDASTHYTIMGGDEGSTVNVRIDSPDTSTRSGW